MTAGFRPAQDWCAFCGISRALAAHKKIALQGHHVPPTFEPEACYGQIVIQLCVICHQHVTTTWARMRATYQRELDLLERTS